MISEGIPETKRCTCRWKKRVINIRKRYQKLRDLETQKHYWILDVFPMGSLKTEDKRPKDNSRDN